MTPCLATIRLPLLLTALFALAACSQDAPAPEAPAPAAQPSAPASAPATAETNPGANAATPAAKAAEPARTPGPIVPPQGPAPVAGTDYVEIAGARPYRPLDGQIEVVEVFGYVCPACARFQPLVNDWKKELPADVRFTYVPAPFGPVWMPYAKAYYVAEGLGLVEQSHNDIIHAIHIANTLPGEGDQPDPAKVAQFYAQYGADPETFLSTMDSFAINAQVNRGKQFMMRSGVNSTPTLVINGKYRVTGGKTFADVLRIADHLIARERAAGADDAGGEAAADAGDGDGA